MSRKHFEKMALTIKDRLDEAERWQLEGHGATVGAVVFALGTHITAKDAARNAGKDATAGGTVDPLALVHLAGRAVYEASRALLLIVEPVALISIPIG